MTLAGTRGVHQVLVGASPGDAITNVAVATRERLRTIGPSEIYARFIEPELIGDVKLLDQFAGAELIIFHASIGQADVHELLMTRDEPIVLVFHNVTPPEYFEPFDPEFASFLARGRDDVYALRSRVVRVVADSRFNALEFEAMGYDGVQVIPPIARARDLTKVTPRPSTADHMEAFKWPVLLSVGQLMPHKRPDFLVEAMHVAETYHGMRNFLLLVGHPRLPRYARAIREQVRDLGVYVHVVGAVDDEDLAAMFRAASAVLSASEHEGFCIPLVEAMRFGKPIVARSYAAIPETVGDAALLLDPSDGPEVYAEAVGEATENKDLREQLVANGQRRLRELEAIDPAQAMVDLVLEAV